MSSREAEAFTIQSAHKTILENVDTLRSQRSGLVLDISRMHDEMIALSKRLDSVRKQGEEEVVRISSERSLAQKQIEELKLEASRVRNHIDGLEPVKRHLEVSISDRQTQLERIENRLSEARTVAEEYATQIDQAKTLWTEVVRRTQDETRSLEQLRAETCRLEPDRKEALELNTHIKRLKLEDSILVATVDELRRAEQELRTKVAALTSAIESQKQREIDIMKAQHEADLVLARTRLEHEVLMNRSIEIRNDNENYVRKTNELETRKAILEKDIIEAQARLHQFEASLEPLREQANQRENELRRVETEIIDARNNLKDLTLQVTEREKRIDALSERHDELMVENRRIEAIVATLHQQEMVFRKKIIEAQNESQQVESEANQARFSLGELNNEIVRNRAINERFATENTALQEAVTRIQEELARLTAEKTKTISETDRSLDKRNSAERELQEVANKTAELNSHSDFLEKQIEDHKRTVAALVTKSSDLETSNTELESTKEALKHELMALKHEKDATEISISESRKSLEEVKNVVEGLRNKQSELTTVQSRVRDLLRHEEQLKASLAQELRTEKMIADRVAKLEHQENQVLGRIDNARNVLAQLEQNQRGFTSTNAELQIKLDQITKSTEEALKKRESLAAILSRETEAVRLARADLREIEEIKNAKLREIEALRNTIGTHTTQPAANLETTNSVASAGNTNPPAPQPNASQQIRADAEKTLEALRRHLDGIIPKRDPSKS